MIPLRRFELLALLFMVVAIFQYPRAMEAKPASFQRHSKVSDTLGVVCKCCDGEGGECRSTWEGSCPKLQCLPWKYQSRFKALVESDTSQPSRIRLGSLRTESDIQYHL